MGEHLEIDRILAESDLVGLAEKLRKTTGPSRLFGQDVRPLNAQEIERLEKQGCASAAWDKVYVADDFDPSRVVRTRLAGTCVLGRFSSTRQIAPGASHPSGIYDSMLVDCEVGDDALVRNVGLAANYLFANEALVSSVGEIIATENPTFGNGTEMALALETGERAVRPFAEMDLDLACRLVCAPRSSDLRKAYEELLRRYLEAIRTGKGYVGQRAVVRCCRRLADAFIGEGAVVEAATLIKNTTVLSKCDEVTRIGDNAVISNSLIQWGCEVTSGALVESSLLTEHSHVERHGKVTHSLLGPNTGVGEGEVTSSLVGPFVGFHHQALLIAAYWPTGKGNLGYGANVGSNHTGKAPDQEIRPAEGMFFGLGVNIKFPSNFERAPYTIIATGVTTLPQKVEFPFSLINVPGRSFDWLSPAFNEIMPGWVLSNNSYALARNEAKFRDRNKARRLRVEFEVLRPETIDLVREARGRLLNAPSKEPVRSGEPVVYLERDIAGLGKNYLLDENRTRAIETYSFFLRFYALRGLYRRLVELERTEGKIADLEGVLARPVQEPRWAHELGILREELPERSVRDLLEQWVEHYGQFAESVRRSKSRDDERGARIIADYGEFHGSADEDKVVRRIANEHKEIKEQVERWLKG